MWQRVQTLYLFIATALVAVLLFCDKTEGVRYTAYWPYLVLLVIVTLLNIIALTTYRFRVFQMRTAILSALVTIALQAWLAVEYFTSELASGMYNFTILFPVVAVIFDFLAARSIFADELMVRSSSRLRAAKHKHKNNTKQL